MHRTTVMLPHELKLKVERVARERGVSLGEVIREALGQMLLHRRKRVSRDSLFADHAVFHGPTPPDLAANHDHYLYDENA